ncbi:hypothetical protein ElyMa_003008300 [Elysia marginata]|uniref:Uncharacterized protein n=1 Tax=Elysia marginata TaxID=1093978 RepID=A0AAV4IHJ5_9GAST|nr:hypothetical protein ElyMa_003008300 [Elysia marginata]
MDKDRSKVSLASAGQTVPTWVEFVCSFSGSKFSNTILKCFRDATSISIHTAEMRKLLYEAAPGSGLCDLHSSSFLARDERGKVHSGSRNACDGGLSTLCLVVFLGECRSGVTLA